MACPLAVPLIGPAVQAICKVPEYISAVQSAPKSSKKIREYLATNLSLAKTYRVAVNIDYILYSKSREEIDAKLKEYEERVAELQQSISTVPRLKWFWQEKSIMDNIRSLDEEFKNINILSIK